MDRKLVGIAVIAAALWNVGLLMVGSAVSGTPPSTDLQSSAPSASSTGDSTRDIQFRGRVAKGQGFEKDIGYGLIFHLTPDDYGWSIDIFPKSGHGVNDYSLVGVATPPFHGINPSTRVEGWQFRNASNTGPDAGSVNERHFLFVMNEADARTVANAIYQYKGNGFSPSVLMGQGRLVVQHLKLGNLIPGSQAWIESMDLNVSLEFPTPTK